MTTEFRVVDCRTSIIAPSETRITASTPEHAARLATGEELVRGSRQSKQLRVRVYSGSGDNLTMVRLYSKSVDASVQKPVDHWGR